MTTLLLVRHGLTAMTGPVLAGWTPGVRLDERGRAQVAALAARLASLPLAAVVSSPSSAAPRRPRRSRPGARARPGRWRPTSGSARSATATGRAALKELAEEPLWRVVQAHPSAARFPGEAGESLADAQHRAVAAVRDWNGRIAAEHGPDALYAVCSHGDIIKSVVADALGLHLDQFQRIQADPASLTVIRYTETRPFAVRVNDTGGDVAGLVPEPPAEGSGGDGPGPGDAVVGGGA